MSFVGGMANVTPFRHEDADQSVKRLPTDRITSAEAASLFPELDAVSPIVKAAFDPARSVHVIPRLEELLGDRATLASLADDELERLRTLVPRIEAACRDLESYALPETIQHDDLHDGQVFVRDGRYVFFDWGDACLSHPFFTLVVTLAVLAYRLELEHGSPELDRFRDAYLEPWTRFRPRSDLEQAYPIAFRLGVLCRGLTWALIVSAIPRPLREQEQDAVPERMRMLLEVYAA